MSGCQSWSEFQLLLRGAAESASVAVAAPLNVGGQRKRAKGNGRRANKYLGTNERDFSAKQLFAGIFTPRTFEEFFTKMGK